MTPSQILRKAIKADPRTYEQLDDASGIDKTVIWRFMQGRKLTSDHFDKLCELYGLNLRDDAPGGQ